MSGRSPIASYDEPMDPAEFSRRVAEIREHVASASGEDTMELVRWFLRRYPSVIDRCRYSTRKYRELSAAPTIAPDRIR